MFACETAFLILEEKMFYFLKFESPVIIIIIIIITITITITIIFKSLSGPSPLCFQLQVINK